MTKSKTSEPGAAKGPRRISIDLPESVSLACAAHAKTTGISEMKLRELVRAKATDAAMAAVDGRVLDVLREHLAPLFTGAREGAAG